MSGEGQREVETVRPGTEARIRIRIRIRGITGKLNALQCRSSIY
jgi:hypothetical protein